MDMDLFYVDRCARFKDTVSRRMKRTFGLEVRDAGVLQAGRRAWNEHRRQHDAYVLLEDLRREMRSKTALWMVDEDLFCENVNFVFGLAMFHVSAVVSTFRLEAPGMVIKEAVHEAGHVMGLQHCKGRCVMRFSNTYDDALQKPDTLCDACRRSVERRLVGPGLRM